MHSISVVSPLAAENIDRSGHEEEPKPWGRFCQNTRYDVLKWYAVRTYSCRERVVAQSFVSQCICHYLPLLIEQRRWSDRIKTVHVPLFKNYLFVKVVPTQEDFRKVVSTRGITGILGDERGPTAIADKEIEAVARMLANMTKLKVVCGFQSGQPVRVKAGPLRGMEGCFVRMEGRDHLAVNINILGQSVLAEINYCEVEPC